MSTNSPHPPRIQAAQKFFDGGQAGTLSDDAQAKGIRPPKGKGKGKGKPANGSSKGSGRKPSFPSMESVTVPGEQGKPYKMAAEPLTMADYRDHCIALVRQRKSGMVGKRTHSRTHLSFPSGYFGPSFF